MAIEKENSCMKKKRTAYKKMAVSCSACHHNKKYLKTSKKKISYICYIYEKLTSPKQWVLLGPVSLHCLCHRLVVHIVITIKYLESSKKWLVTLVVCNKEQREWTHLAIQMMSIIASHSPSLSLLSYVIPAMTGGRCCHHQ